MADNNVNTVQDLYLFYAYYIFFRIKNFVFTFLFFQRNHQGERHRNPVTHLPFHQLFLNFIGFSGKFAEHWIKKKWQLNAVVKNCLIACPPAQFRQKLCIGGSKRALGTRPLPLD